MASSKTRMAHGTCTTNARPPPLLPRPRLRPRHRLTNAVTSDNPDHPVAGNQHWGHATSSDLYTWTNQPIALYPPTNDSYAFTGSIVVDVNNTSGFFPSQDNGVVAILTIAVYGSNPLQSQFVAYSYDNGFSFTYYSANPVLDIHDPNFRDPKVVWYEDHWVMAVAIPQELVVAIYTSPNLLDWSHASNFTHHGLLGLQYECPNLVPVPAAPGSPSSAPNYVMLVSINPGAPLGGSASEIFLGTFDGYTFTAHDAGVRLTDFAKDDYAPQFFWGYPGSTAISSAVHIGWASNWEYTQVVPTASEGWRSAMTLPRTAEVRSLPRVGWVLATPPYDLTPVLDAPLLNQTWIGNGSAALDFADLASNAVYLRTNITDLPTDGTAAGEWHFSLLSPVSGESLRGGMVFGGGESTFWIDRGRCLGFDNRFFTDKFSVAMVLHADGSWTVEMVVDRSVLEVYIDDGENVATSLFFAEQPLTLLSVSTYGLPPGNTTVSTEVWGLKSTWVAQQDADGIVRGNVTGASATATSVPTYKAQFASV